MKKTINHSPNSKVNHDVKRNRSRLSDPVEETFFQAGMTLCMVMLGFIPWIWFGYELYLIAMGSQ